MWKLALVRVSYWYDIAISYRVYVKNEISFRVYIKGHFMTANLWVTKQICDCDAILDWLSKTTLVLPVPDSRESDSTPGQTVKPRLHDISMSFECFHTRIKISLWYSDQGELTPVWLAPIWDFALVSCKQINYIEPQEGTRVNSCQNESRASIMF